jgi:hypothetical protein
MKFPESKYLRFILFPENHYLQSEEVFRSFAWKQCRQLALVSKDALENCLNKKDWERVLCIFSSITGRESTERLDKFHWKYRLSSGGFFTLKQLIFEDDFLEYVNGRLEFSEMRTAFDLINET